MNVQAPNVNQATATPVANAPNAPWVVVCESVPTTTVPGST